MPRFTFAAAALLALLAGTAAQAAPAPGDWIAREKIRAGWIYHGDGVQQLARFKEQGMNALITNARPPEGFDAWARQARSAGMHLFGVLGFSFDAEKAGASSARPPNGRPSNVPGIRRAVFGNGYESVVACPTDERFWQERMIAPAVQLAREGMTPEKEISGILIDFELYANSNKGGQIYYTDACYCDHCFGAFLKHKALEDVTKQVPFAGRVAWLREKSLFAEYHPFLQGEVRALAAKMRQAVEAVRPDFFLGFYPIPHNWMLVGVAQGLGTPAHPMILWATETYGGGGPHKIADDWRAAMEKQEIHCYYCGGMLLRMYSAANLAHNMYQIAKKASGYWLFTVHTLCLREEEQSGDYYLSAGTPDDYLREIRRANAELDNLCADPAYQALLQPTEEPVRYRNPGFDVGRFRAPALEDRSPAGHGAEKALPPLPLIGGNFLMMRLAAGEEAAVRFQTDRAKSGDVWGVSYAVLGPDKAVLRQGKLPPGEESTVKVKAGAAGVYTLVLTAGYYGRCTPLASTVPLALWTADRFEISRPGGTVYFPLPAGLDAFEIAAQCEWGTNAVKLAVCAPDGSVVKEEETDPFVRSLKLSVPAAGRPAGLWALKVAPVPGKSYRSVTIRFDKKLPQWATLTPEHVFAQP